MQTLEARLQVKLLHRTTRKAGLTADGAAYMDEARRLLRELAELEAGLGHSARSPSGRLRVDVPAAAGRHVLAPALPDFFARYPELVVELGSSDRPIDLLAEGVDCVIRGGDMYDDSLVGRKLGELPVVTCAAPGYLAARGIPQHPDELVNHRFVGFFSTRTGRVFEVDFRRGDETRVLHPPQQLASNDADTWISGAVAGLGLVQAPCSRHVREHLRTGALVRVLPDWQAESLPLAVLWPKNRHLAARVRAFVDWVIEVFAEECRAAALVAGP